MHIILILYSYFYLLRGKKIEERDMRINLYSFIIMLLFPIVTILKGVHVRLALSEDMDAIMALDISISEEYFKPLLLQYPEFKEKIEEVEKLLNDEIESDVPWFTNCIALEKQQRLYVAQDGEAIVGFAVCHQQDDTTMVIDLLMIDPSYRGKGIGRQLITASIQAFPQPSTCIIVVLDNNTLARAVYEKMGFILMDKKPLFVQEKYPEPRYICYAAACNIIF